MGIHSVFFATSCMLVAAGLVSLLLVREEAKVATTGSDGGFLEGMKEIFAQSQMRLIFLILFAVQISAMIIEPIVTLYVSLLPGTSPANLATVSGAVFAASGLAAIVAAPYGAGWATGPVSTSTSPRGPSWRRR